MNGIRMIEAERARQTRVEGYMAEHDDEHVGGELARLAGVYALLSVPALEPASDQIRMNFCPPKWDEWCKPKDRIRNLVRAGALLAAEIDRLQRLEDKTA